MESLVVVEIDFRRSYWWRVKRNVMALGFLGVVICGQVTRHQSDGQVNTTAIIKIFIHIFIDTG